MYNFDEGAKRKGTYSVKWDAPFIGEDITPMWIADMDFEVPPAVKENLHKIVEQGAYGYQFLSEEYYQTVIYWMKKRHNYEVTREEINYLSNTVLGLNFGIQTVSEPGDEIIIMTPVYGPFYKAVEDNDRIIVESPLKNNCGYYTMDLEDLESKITSKTKAVMLCNPHNPSGRVWTRDELQALSEVCLKHNLYILSDDVHCDLTSKGHDHTFIGAVSEEIRQKCIIYTSPAKPFNLAGIHVANVLISNAELREKFCQLVKKLHAGGATAFTEAALKGSYHSSEWLDALNDYIEENHKYFADYINRELKNVTVYPAEGTYLAWVDFTKTGVPSGELKDYLLKECKVAVNDGEFFGKEGAGFARFNLACPRKNISSVLEKLKEKFGK